MDSKKKGVIIPKNNKEECFKWVFIATLHHNLKQYVKVEHHTERISLLQHYEVKYNWQVLEFPLVIHKLVKFGKNKSITVNVLFKCKKATFSTQRSEFNGRSSKQADLLITVDGKNRHYTINKNFSQLLKSLNANHKGAYHFCKNCSNGFKKQSYQKTSTMSTAETMVKSMSKCFQREKNYWNLTIVTISRRFHISWKKVRHQIQKRSTCFNCLNGVYTTHLLVEIFFIHWRYTAVKIM